MRTPTLTATDRLAHQQNIRAAHRRNQQAILDMKWSLLARLGAAHRG